jgi:hypothetical protein
MTEKLINVAIFWLPLLAGIILSGLAPSIWYGGDKLAALWIAFVGIVCLLLTATIQIQGYVQANILQPQFEVEPQQRSILVWGQNPHPNILNVKGENDQIPGENWKVPAFNIKNKTPENAQDVRIRWSAPKYDPTAITAKAPIFNDRQIEFSNNSFLLAAPKTDPGRSPFTFSMTMEKPFITRASETYIPLDVWNTAAVYFLATLPTDAAARSEPYYFDLEITWSIPENSKPARFRVRAVATNTKPAGVQTPFFSAIVEFSVEPDNS